MNFEFYVTRLIQAAIAALFMWEWQHSKYGALFVFAAILAMQDNRS